jgi:amino acid transporter
MNYFQNGQGDGIIILVLAGATALLCLIRRFSLLWLTGLGSLGLVAFTFISFQSHLSTAKKSIKEELAGNPFAELAAMAVQSVQIQWGIAVLAIGAILVVTSAAIPSKK